MGEPAAYQSLAVFPLHVEGDAAVEYRLAEEALADESAEVEEISESGSVPELRVRNRGDFRVLFLEGQELVGAKQNRILNTSVLVAARSELTIPVSCVEAGRWSYRSKKFYASGAYTPAKLRRSLKQSVFRSLREQEGHRSDQGAVWDEVAELNRSARAESATDAMAASFEKHRARLAEFQRNLRYIEGAAGIALAVGGRIVSADIFDQPATCSRVWHQVLSGQVFDAMHEETTGETAVVADVERFLESARELPWEESPAVGEGVEYRAQSPRGDVASMLVLNGAVVHGSIVAGE